MLKIFTDLARLLCQVDGSRLARFITAKTNRGRFKCKEVYKPGLYESVAPKELFSLTMIHNNKCTSVVVFFYTPT